MGDAPSYVDAKSTLSACPCAQVAEQDKDTRKEKRGRGTDAHILGSIIAEATLQQHPGKVHIRAPRAGNSIKYHGGKNTRGRSKVGAR